MTDSPIPLSHKAFGFVRVAARPEKPRKTGLTVLADRGLGPAAQADLLELVGDYVDYAKFGMGAQRLYDPEVLARKIKIYKDRDIRIFMAGEFSELAIMQGCAERYYEAIREVGADAVELSNAQVALPLNAKLKLLKLAQSKGIGVIAECGQKGRAEWATSGNYVRTEVRRLLDAGAEKVLIQAEGVNEDVEENNEQLLLDIVSDVGLEPIIFQAKEKGMPEWFLTTFGNEVNLDVDNHQVLELETLRRGIRKRGVFAMMAGLDD